MLIGNHVSKYVRWMMNMYCSWRGIGGSGLVFITLHRVWPGGRTLVGGGGSGIIIVVVVVVVAVAGKQADRLVMNNNTECIWHHYPGPTTASCS